MDDHILYLYHQSLIYLLLVNSELFLENVKTSHFSRDLEYLIIKDKQ